jgi:hypothetical protein
MSASPSVTPPSPPRPRFSWPMRFFLGFVLFDMVFHSFAALVPYGSWCKEYEIAKMPRGLPDPELREELARASVEADHNLLTERVMSSFDSLWEYWRPWPGPESRKKMSDLEDVSKVAVAWTATRLDFIEHLFRVKQGWIMFSPNVGKYDEVYRARLVFADGSKETVRTIAEPADLVHFDSFRFGSEKWLISTWTRIGEGDEDSQRGFCNLLAHRRPRNEAGSALKIIYLVSVRYNYPKPGEDAREFMESQKVPLGEEKNAPFYEYDVTTRKGRKIKERRHE